MLSVQQTAILIARKIIHGSYIVTNSMLSQCHSQKLEFLCRNHCTFYDSIILTLI